VKLFFYSAQPGIEDLFNAAKALLEEPVLKLKAFTELPFHRSESAIHVCAQIGDPYIHVMVAEKHTEDDHNQRGDRADQRQIGEGLRVHAY
jgi:hypothetical protein